VKIKSSYKGLLYAGFTALLWGFLAIALKVSLESLDPVTIVWFRFSVAFFILLIILLFFDKSLFKTLRRPPPLVFLAGFFLGLNYLGFISGIHLTTPANAQVFIQVGPVSLAIVGIVYFREKVNWKHFVGFGFLIGGFTLFYSEQISELNLSGGDYTRGVLYVVAGGLSWACFSILQKTLVVKWNPNHLNLIIYGFCALLFLPFVEYERFPLLSLNEWILLIFLGVNTLLAYGSLALALKYAEANKISVIITLNPIITFIVMELLAIAAVSWIEPEQFTVLSVVGAAIVFTGASFVIPTRKKTEKF
jgi:drug/metabolite transporter (DMT)-like permease